VHAGRERRRNADAVQVGDERGDARGVLDGIDAREFGRQGLAALGLERAFVEEAGVQAGDLGKVRIGGIHHPGQLVHQRAQLVLHGVAQRIEAAVAALVGRNLRGVEPLAVDESEEVVLGPHAPIHVLQFQAGIQGRGRSIGRHGAAQRGAQARGHP
jgi:hypothetical protein